MSDNFSNDELFQELLNDFIIESSEGLDTFDRELLELENYGDLEKMNVIFRVIHTIKGTAGCLALLNIETIAHAGENLLSLMREGEIVPSKSIITSLLSLSDTLKTSLQKIEETGKDEEEDHSELLAQLEQHLTPVTEDKPEKSEAFGLFEDADKEPEKAKAVVNKGQTPTEKSKNAQSPETKKQRPSVVDTSIRVGVAQLDKVMNMVGELVLARNQIIANTTTLDEAALSTASQRLNVITTELQESVMKTRMQPIGNIWAKFPKVVRDISTELSKEVRLVMDGQETELDRTIIEAIKDPLTHIVRNAIDHGIEDPETRVAKEKPREGTLILRAYHEGGQIIIEITDDGAGIDIKRVKEKAIKKDLINSKLANALSEKEIINLIFKPGFSTAETISNVSGRGVGMDVVKTNIESTGGSVEFTSDFGQGSCIKIKIPLTLAIIPALTIVSGGDRYAIPQVSLLELVRLEGDHADNGIEELYGTQVYRLRGKLLPIVYLNEQLKTGSRDSSPTASEDAITNIIVLQADGRQFGLIVDEINDTEEIVVKPLSRQLKTISCFSGATIMGDGKVALILDVLGIAQHSKIISESNERLLAANEEDKEASSQQPTQTLLLFTVGQDNLMAIPLSQAARLEEFDKSQIEYTSHEEVVQYRGDILPLIRVSDVLETPSSNSPVEDDGKLEVVVYSTKGRTYGLVVDQIQDIIEENIQNCRKSNKHGIQGSSIVQGKVTDLLDIPQIIERMDTQTSASVS